MLCILSIKKGVFILKNNEKENVLKRVDEIHLSLIDKERVIPYNYNILIMWGILSFILYLDTAEILLFKIFSPSISILIIISIGFLIERYFTGKENIKYNIGNLTKIQIFIRNIYILTILFSIILTSLFLMYNLHIVIYPSWIFLIGLANYICGFIKNDKKFLWVGIINIIIAIFIFLLISIFKDISIYIIKFLAIIFSSGGFIYLGIKKRGEKLNSIYV